MGASIAASSGVASIVTFESIEASLFAPFPPSSPQPTAYAIKSSEPAIFTMGPTVHGSRYRIDGERVFAMHDHRFQLAVIAGVPSKRRRFAAATTGRVEEKSTSAHYRGLDCQAGCS